MMSQKESEPMQEFDQQTLAEFNGSREDGRIYVAREGKVFDVSGSQLWKTGTHMNRHKAGKDLTGDFPAAPHGEEVFEKFPQVGVLVEERGEADQQQLPPWLDRFLDRHAFFRRHPHPMLIHYPIVFMFATAGFMVLALLTGNRSFEVTSFHCLGAGLMFIPPAMATGFLTWWINYRSRPMRPVQIKIWCSLLLLLDSAVVFTWRLLEPDILVTRGISSYIYAFFIFSLVPIVSIIGWFGAQLTFPLAPGEKQVTPDKEA
jgi:predicted heme/steroid binding protein/uncharacterized membrane protein